MRLGLWWQVHAELSDYILYSRGLQVVKVGHHSHARPPSSLPELATGFALC